MPTRLQIRPVRRGGVWLALREAFEEAAFFRKNRAAYDAGRARPLKLSPLELEALLPVLAGEEPLVLEANRASDILDALAFAREQHLRLVITGAVESWKVADQLAEAKVPVVIQPSYQQPSTFDELESRDDLPALLEKAAVPIIIDSIGFPSSCRRVRQEAGIAVANGLSYGTALKAITLEPALAFGHAESGSIAVGKRADVVLWSGDPLEVSTVAERVWINGVEQPMRDRTKELAERYR